MLWPGATAISGSACRAAAVSGPGLPGDGGLGLGLSIVDGIATAHRAQIEAGPGLGGGLTVVVRFPAGQVEMSG
jgi:signal transduction histidine kinase